MEAMKTIVIIARHDDWEKALKAGEYTQSTIDSTLAEVGFIHCSFPDQTIEIANRRFTSQDDLQLLFVDVEKVKAPIKYEGALSGRVGTFPHIYGALNTDAVHSTIPLIKGKDGKFITPDDLEEVGSTGEFAKVVQIMANTPPISNEDLKRRKN